MEAPISVIGFSSAFCAISISLNIMSTPSYPTTFRNFQLHQPQRLMNQCSFHYITIRGGLTELRPEGLWRRLRRRRSQKAATSDGGALLFHRSCLFNHDGRSGPLHYLPVSLGCQCPAPVYRHSRCLQAGNPDRLESAIRLRPAWTSQ